MDRRRLPIFILLILGIALFVGLGAYLFFGGGAEQLGLVDPTSTPTPLPPTATPEPGVPTAVATTAPEQEFVTVVVSLQTVPRGFQLTASELVTETRLANQIQSNVITDIDSVIGKYTRRDVYQGETLTIDSVVSDIRDVGREEFGPSSLIPPGYVAVGVPTDRQAGVAYGLETGDFVDILISFDLRPVDEQFQTLLPNNATYYLTIPVPTTDEEGNTITETVTIPYTIDPQGRFETLPSGDLVNVQPSEQFPRSTHVAFVIQNAKVIETGNFVPPLPPLLPTSTPDPEAEAEAGETGESVEGEAEVVGTVADVQDAIEALTGPPYNFSMVLALPPQQVLILKYAIETEATIDYALRGSNDGQLYAVENVDLNFIIDRFNVEIPPNFTYIVETDDTYFLGYQNDNDVIVALTPEPEGTPASAVDGEESEEGGE